MNSNLKPFMIIAGVAVLGAIGFFALQNPSVPTEHGAGAIGTVDKVHSEQINPSDVQLADGASPGDAYTAASEWIDEVATTEDIAGLLDLASPQERTSFAARMPFEMQVAMLGRYDAADLGKAYRAMDSEAKVMFFRSLPSDMQRSYLQGKNVADFEARGVAAQAKVVADLGNREISAGMREFANAAREVSAARTSMQGRSAIEMERAQLQASRSEFAGKAAVMGRVSASMLQAGPQLALEKAFRGAPSNERVAMARAIPAAGRVSLMGRSTPAQRSAIVGRADIGRTAKALGRGDVFEAHSILARADVAARSELAMSRGEYTLGDRALFGRINYGAKVAAFEKMTVAEKSAVLGAMSITSEKWSTMDQAGRTSYMGKMDIATERMWFQRTALSERASAVQRLSVSEAKTFMRTTPSGRVSAFLKAIPTAERNSMLGRAWLGSREMQGRSALQGRNEMQGRSAVTERASATSN